MPEAKWNRAKDVFHQALAKSGPDRVRFVDAACGDDAEVRAQVEELLAAHDAAGDFLVLPTTSAGGGPTGTGQERTGTRIGPYKLLQLIGEGGFGEVYMAEQEDPIRRRVALKIIKPGMGTKEVIARFESERQALALMDHPNIAKVFDAGATESGRPYFVMELVKGVPITDYCDANRLSTRERLDLFVQVCKAVHHAHEKGIVHRDIKPSNVMVTLHDGTPVPKVIDFGVAKATNQRLTEKTLFTAYGACVGTPVYMSPEQAEMSGLDVDRRSDIYSLGVLLYELLTGTTPFNAERLRAAAFIELLRIIREEDPPTPSHRLGTLGDQLADIAGKRNVDPQLLSKLVRGDLDWIVMKTIDKDRRRRYDTVSDLVADMSRYFKDEPVIARRPSVAYRLGKFAKRQRTSLMIAATVALTLIAGTALALGGFGLRGSAAALDSGTLTARRVDVPLDSTSSLTPDGRLAAISDWTTGDLAVYDMSSGQTRRLMASPGWSQTNGWPEGGVLSPDLRQVAYTWSTPLGLDQRYQLRVMPNQPGAPPRILVDSPEYVYFIPTAWSRDGQSVLAQIMKSDRSMQLAWISAADGAIRVLKSLARRTSDRVSLSPDGRYVLYSARQRPDTVNSSIHVMAADGRGETELVGGGSINEAPAWAPDGARVFFTSNRSGRFALWSIEVRNGTAFGDPVLVKPELGRIQAMGFTSSGTYYYMHVTPARDLFVAELNPSDSKLRASPVAITETYTGSRLPAWSPDGNAVAFARETNPNTFEDNDLVVRVVDTGQERTYAGADVTGQPIWLPDGKSLLIPTRRQNRASLHRVNLETGDFTFVLDKDIRQAALAPDRKTLYAAIGRTIQAIDLPTGRERQVFGAPGPNDIGALALSPNGQTLAFAMERRVAGLVGVDGAGFREVPAAGIRQVAWTRDGRAILYEAFGASALGAGGPSDRKLMRLPVEGGTPEFTGVDLEGVFSLTSDGTRLVFSRSRGTLSRQRRVEVWALDNLLAKPAR